MDRAVEASRVKAADVERAAAAAAPVEAAAPVWKSKFYGAFVLHRRVVLHAIDAAPAR